eukprot:3045789-Prymnesium_polylepis.4
MLCASESVGAARASTACLSVGAVPCLSATVAHIAMLAAKAGWNSKTAISEESSLTTYAMLSDGWNCISAGEGAGEGAGGGGGGDQRTGRSCGGGDRTSRWVGFVEPGAGVIRVVAGGVQRGPRPRRLPLTLMPLATSPHGESVPLASSK